MSQAASAVGLRRSRRLASLDPADDPSTKIAKLADAEPLYRPKEVEEIADDDAIIPSYLVCEMTLEIFRDPVTCADGHTYEREFIEKVSIGDFSFSSFRNEY